MLPRSYSLASLVADTANLLLSGIKSFREQAQTPSPTLSISDPIVQRVKALFYQVYEMVNTDDVAGANQFAKEKILSIVDIQTAVDIGNLLLRDDKAFRDFIQLSIEHSIQKTTPHVKFGNLSADGKPVPGFRSIRVNGQYGDPESVMEQGFTASLLNTRPGAADIVVPASIVSFTAEETTPGEYTVKLTVPDRYDMLGFTFGPMISISLNVFHALEERYIGSAARKEEGDRIIYLIAVTKAFNTAHAIHEGTGYIRDRAKGLRGEKGTSCQEDAAEAAAGTVVEKHEVMGYRIRKANGDILEFVKNPHASAKLLEELMQFSDVQTFMRVKTAKEAKEHEVLLIDEPEKVENHTTKLLRFMRKNKELTKEIISSARGFAKDELLHHQVHGHALVPAHTTCAETLSYADLFVSAKEHKRSIRHGLLIEGQRHLFHTHKARSEKELIELVVEAKKQAAGITTKVDKTPIKQKSLELDEHMRTTPGKK